MFFSWNVNTATWSKDGKKVERTFPIQRLDSREPLEIPWEIAEEAYAEYALQYGGGQSLERLAERGGFGTTEMITLLYERLLRHTHRDR